MKFQLPLLCSAIASLCFSLYGDGHEPLSEEPELLKVVNPDAEIKSGKTVITTVPEGKGLIKIKEQGSWIGVRFFQNGIVYKGWIRKDDIAQHDGVFPKPAVAAEPADTEAAVVAVAELALAKPAEGESEAPGDEPPAPGDLPVEVAGDEPPAPADEPPAPAEEPPAPGDEPPAPVDEPPAPAEEPPAPADEPPAPADEPPPPPTDNPPPPGDAPPPGEARPVKMKAGTTTLNFGPPPGTDTPPVPPRQPVSIDPAELSKPPVIIRLKSVNELLKKVQGLVMQVQPMMAGMVTIDGLLSQAGPMKDAIKQTLDFDKPIGFVVFGKEGGPPPPPGQPPVDVCAILPVKDEQAAGQLVQQMGGGMFKASFNSGYALVAMAPGLAEKAQAALAMVQDPSDMQGDLEFFINAASYAKAMENYKPAPPGGEDMEELPPEMQEEMKKSQENYKKGVEAANAGVKVIGEEFTVMRSGLRITPTALELFSSGSSRTGSQTAALLASLKAQPAPELAGRLPHQDAMILGSLRISSQMLGDWMAQALDKAMAEKEAPTKEDQQVIDLLKQVSKISAGNMAFAVVTGQGKPSFVSIMGTQESAAELVDQIKALGIAEAEKKGETVQESTREHNGATITTFKEETKKEVIEVATTDDMVFVSAGETAESLTNQIIDAAAGEAPQQLSSVAEKVGGAPVGMFSASVLKIAAASMGGAGGEMPPQLQAMAALDDPIIGGINVDGQNISGKLIIPAKAMQLIQAVVMQAMMGGGGGPGGPPPGGFGPPPGDPPPPPPPPGDAPAPDNF